jgi:hypothetical protein
MVKIAIFKYGYRAGKIEYFKWLGTIINFTSSHCYSYTGVVIYCIYSLNNRNAIH